jgi:hypothetical protein
MRHRGYQRAVVAVGHEILVIVTCPPDSPGFYAASPASAAYSVGVRFPSALWGRTSL